MRKLSGVVTWTMLLVVWTSTALAADVYRQPELKAALQRKQGFKVLHDGGGLPAPWGGNTFDKNSIGELVIESAPDGELAMGVRTLEGRPSAQLYNWRLFDLPGPCRVTIRFDYYSGDAGGAFRWQVGGVPEAAVVDLGQAPASGDSAAVQQRVFALPPSEGKFSTFSCSLLVKQGTGKLGLNFQSKGLGADQTLYFRNIRITREPHLELDEGKPLSEASQPVAGAKERWATVLRPEVSADAETRRDETAATSGWTVLLDWAGEEAPAEPQAGMDLSVYRSRDYRIARPRYSASSDRLWLQRGLDLPDDAASSSWLFTVGNNRIVRAAYLNGVPLSNLTRRHEATQYTEDALKVQKMTNHWDDVGWWRQMGLTNNLLRWAEPARLLIKPEMLRPEGNVLVLHVDNVDLFGDLLGDTQLRRAGLADIATPFAHTRSEGEFGSVSVIGLEQNVPGQYEIEAQIEVQDYFGRVLRQETQTLQLPGWPEETKKNKRAPRPKASFDLTPQGPAEHKAVVTFRLGSETLAPYWVYLMQRVRDTPSRVRFELDGFDWEQRYHKKGTKITFPLPDNEYVVRKNVPYTKYRPAYVPGIQRHNWQHLTNSRGHDLTLRKTFRLPPSMQQRERIRLVIEKIYWGSEVYLNGERLGTVHFYEAPAELDVTEHIEREGENELVIHAFDLRTFANRFATTAKESMLKTMWGDMVVIGSTRLEAGPAVRVTRTWIDTSVNEKRLAVRTWLHNDSDRPVTATLEATVFDREGDTLSLPAWEVKLDPGQTKEVSTQQPWPDPQLWSPWSPHLYGLRSQLRVGGEVVDEHLTRFGFREIQMQGHRILVNGEVFNGRGVHIAPRIPIWRHLDANWTANDLLRRQALGANFIRERKIDSWLHDFYDESGMMTSVHFGPWINGRGRNMLGVDDETRKLYMEEARAYIPFHVNRPSMLKYNVGNEVVCGTWGSDEGLNDLIASIGDDILARDPSRSYSSNGSSDLMGRAPTLSIHYPPNPWFFYKSRKDVPSELLERTAMGSSFHENSVAAKRLKPIYSSEWSWVTIRNPTQLQIIPYAEARADEMASQRHSEVALSAAFQHTYMTHRNFEPIASIFLQKNGRFWADRPVSRKVDVWNDSGRDATIQVELRVTQAESQPHVVQKDVSLKQGHRATVDFEIPAMAVEEPTVVRAELISRLDGEVCSRREAQWTIFPRAWLPDLSGLKVGILDPGDSAKGMLDGTGAQVTRLQSTADIKKLSQGDLDLLIIGEDLENHVRAIAPAPLAINEYVTGGGRVLMLRQQSSLDWLCPIFRNDSKAKGFGTPFAAWEHAVFEGLAPGDLDHWGETGLVHGMAYAWVTQGNTRVLAGQADKHATLIEFAYGDGRLLLSALELTPSKVRSEPAAARLLRNALRYLRQGSSERIVDALVLVGPGQETAWQLRNKIKLDATYRSTLPASLDAFGVIILCGWQEQAPPDEWAGPLRQFVESGGLVWAANGDPALPSWLATTLGLETRAEKIPNLTDSIRVVRADPAVVGLTGKLGPWYGRRNQQHAVKPRKGTELVVPEQGVALLNGDRLVRTDVGSGVLLLDTALNTLGNPAQNQGNRLAYLRTVATNLGIQRPVPEPNSTVTTLMAEVDFQPLDITPAANETRHDDKKGDKKGWMDAGSHLDMRPLKAGRLIAKGVPFDIPDERATGQPGAIVLRSGNHLKHLPTESRPIPVGRKARGLFFLHAGAFAKTEKGRQAFEYEVRYQGYSKLIPGEDTSPYTETIPIRVGIEMGDWYGKKANASAVWEDGWRHLYMAIWENPHPDRPIESIVVRSGNRGEVPMVLGVTLGVDNK